MTPALVTQGQLPCTGQLASLSQQMHPAAAAAANQATSNLAHAHSRTMSDLLGSVTGRINRGTLEDPSSSFEDPAFGQGQFDVAPGQFGAVPGQGLWQSPSTDLLHGLHDVLPGKPVGSGSDAFHQGQPPELVASSSRPRRSTTTQPTALLQLLAQRAPPHNLRFQGGPPAAPPSAPGPPALVPEPQQPQWHLPEHQFSPSAFQTGSGSMGFMHSSQVSQLQAFPASPQEPVRAGSWDLRNSSRRTGGRPSRRISSQSLRPSSGSPAQVSGQDLALEEEAQHASQRRGPPALPLVAPLHRATSLSPGLGGPLGSAPVSGSPTLSNALEAMPPWGQALEQIHPTPLAWQAVGSGQGVASPAVLTQHAGGDPFYQPTPGGGWDPSGVAPQVLEGCPMSRGRTSAKPGPGVHCP